MHMRKLKLLLLMGLLCSIQLVWAQTTVTGKITDQNGAPVPGATITIKNTALSTVSDANGNFSISAPANARVVIS